MTITMNGIKWHIRFTGINNPLLTRSDGTQTIGVTDNDTKSVFIYNGLNSEMVQKVLCHELCHVACFSYDVDMPIETEEIVADFLSLYGFEIITCAEEVIDKLMDKIA